MTEAYDVVVIGAGAAGLTVGATLAAKENKKVLVVERAPEIGGRLASFVGDKGALTRLDKELDTRQFQRALTAVYTRLVRAQPELPTMIGKGLLNGYTFEAGCHATFWGKKGRVASALEYLGRYIPLPGNEGLVIIDPRDNRWYQLERHASYGWMSEEGNREAKKLLGVMATLSREEADKYELMSLGQWLDARTQSAEAYDYIRALASIHMVMGDANRMPAVDFLKFMAAAKEVGMNLITGSTGSVGRPGFVQIAAELADVLHQAGGQIQLETSVREVIITNKKVTGVVVSTGGGTQKIGTSAVVCTVPVNHIFEIISEENFPADFVTTVKERFWGVGMLSGYVGLKRHLLLEKKVDPKSWLLVPSLLKSEDGYIGNVDIINFISSNWVDRAPVGKHLWEFSIALTDKETRDDVKVNRVVDAITKLMQTNFPTWSQDVDWQLWTVSSEGYGVCPPIGERRPDVKCPWVDGLYFAGEGYGIHRWGMGLDAAIHSAVLCLDAVGNRNYSSEMLPAYHR